MKLSREATTLIAVGLMCLTASFVAFFIWPTPYKCHIENGHAWQVNRFTGRTTVQKAELIGER